MRLRRRRSILEFTARVSLERRRAARCAVALLAAGATVAALAGALADGGTPDAVLRRTAVEMPAAAALPADPPSDRRELAADIDRTQAIIDDALSTSTALQSASGFEQLATAELARAAPNERGAILALLHPSAAATIRTNLAAATALDGLAEPSTRLPNWKIIQPPAPSILLSYFRAAQRHFGVPWEYLAAIEFIETRFGRVQGQSSAGAQGPMQFMPSTWAVYGTGNIHNQHDAIWSAARYLVASGAPRDMAAALYHYNNSLDYVHAVEDYAARMSSDPRAYYGYYYWQVLYVRAGALLILPVGYPRVRPVPIRLRRIHASRSG
jgi:hypothetical protein